MVPQLPRAPAGEIVALDGAFFNRLMDIIAALSNLTVTPPLILNDGPAGRTLSVMGAVNAIPVTLSNPSGSAGTNSPPAAATYVYDVADAQTGISIKTGVSVWMARQKGHVTAATKGFAAYIQGTLYIVAHDEVLDTTTC